MKAVIFLFFSINISLLTDEGYNGDQETQDDDDQRCYSLQKNIFIQRITFAFTFSFTHNSIHFFIHHFIFFLFNHSSALIFTDLSFFYPYFHFYFLMFLSFPHHSFHFHSLKLPIIFIHIYPLIYSFSFFHLSASLILLFCRSVISIKLGSN